MTEAQEQDVAAGAYLVSRIKAALATDERTHMLDVLVEVLGSSVFLSGNVNCQARKSAAEEVARELVSDAMQIVNSLCVEVYYEPTDPEPLD